jgi:hypothetical protein
VQRPGKQGFCGREFDLLPQIDYWADRLNQHPNRIGIPASKTSIALPPQKPV